MEIKKELNDKYLYIPIITTLFFFVYEMVMKNGHFIGDLKGGFYNISESYYEIDGLNSKVVEKYLSKAYKEFYLRFSKAFEFLINTRSYSELKWLFLTSLPFIKKLILRS